MWLKLSLLILITSLSACKTAAVVPGGTKVTLPFIKNSASECYYLDEFMPVPDSMVRGKSGALSLRYYSYNAATYKDWEDQHIVLSFYSQDSQCWSLFEEYFVSGS